VLDAHAHEASGNGDSVLGHELLEGHEEAGLDGNAAGDGGVAMVCQCMFESTVADFLQHGKVGRAGDEEAEQVEQEAHDVREHGHKHDELGELLRAPRPLEVAPAIEDGEPRRDQAKQILLHHRRQRKDPRVYDGPAGHEGEVRHAVADADEGLLDLLDPVRVRPQRKVEQCEDDLAGEQAARQRREVDARHGRLRRSNSEGRGRRAVAGRRCGRRRRESRRVESLGLHAFRRWVCGWVKAPREAGT
jgi:hypothetical protein